MLGTNVVLDILHNEKAAMERLSDFQDHLLAISYLVYIEVMAGAQLRVKADTEKFLKRFIIKDFNKEAQESGKRLSKTYFIGKETKPMDLLIAAHAKAENTILITNNAKDFLFRGLRVHPYTK